MPKEIPFSNNLDVEVIKRFFGNKKELDISITRIMNEIRSKGNLAINQMGFEEYNYLMQRFKQEIAFL